MIKGLLANLQAFRVDFGLVLRVQDCGFRVLGFGLRG